jgi:hypothetical protein
LASTTRTTKGLTMHCDLGQRWPPSDCPTRVNPEIKKAYARDNHQVVVKPENKNAPKMHSYSISQICFGLGVNQKTFSYHAEKVTGKKSTNAMSNDEVMQVLDWFKTHKIKRPMKRNGKK